MTLESLLLSQDPELVRVLRPTLEELSIEVELCEKAATGANVLGANKFDAVIVDCDDLVGGLDLLKGIRSTPSNKNSVAFAVLNGNKTTAKDAFGMGASFVLQKPITPLNASRCLHAALNLMLKERRRYFRQPVKIQVKLNLGGNVLVGTSTNISEGGLAVVLPAPLPKGAVPRVKFALPGSDIHIDVAAEVAWIDLKGFAGLRFQHMPKSSQIELEHWLDAHMEREFPGSQKRISAFGPQSPEGKIQQ